MHIQKSLEWLICFCCARQTYPCILQYGYPSDNLSKQMLWYNKLKSSYLIEALVLYVRLCHSKYLFNILLWFKLNFFFLFMDSSVHWNRDRQYRMPLCNIITCIVSFSGDHSFVSYIFGNWDCTF